MTSTNVYDKLYNSTKAKFTVMNGENEYTLGEYMLMKAGKKTEKSKLPAARAINGKAKPVSTIFSYINDKMTIKNPPAKDKTIKRFPMRTSAAAFLSALVMSALALSFALFSAAGIISPDSAIADSEYSESESENNEYSNEK